VNTYTATRGSQSHEIVCSFSDVTFDETVDDSSFEVLKIDGKVFKKVGANCSIEMDRL
jgi:hypothetical protein